MNEEGIRGSGSPTAEERLIAQQRSEFDRAAILQEYILQIQIAITILACAAVYVPVESITYLFVILTLIASLLWAYLSFLYRDVRFTAERVRRATLISVGFGTPIAPAEMRHLGSHLPDVSSNASGGDAPYYAATEAPGQQRLAEMLEESAFWSAFLLSKSARRAWLSFTLFSCSFLILTLSLLPFLVTQQWLELGRIVSSMLILLISADVFGTAHQFSRSARAVEQVTLRLQTIKAAQYPLPDLLILLGDYNSAVEAAPSISVSTYKKYRSTLNRLWASR